MLEKALTLNKLPQTAYIDDNSQRMDEELIYFFNENDFIPNAINKKLAYDYY
jgi:hypothetical protein